jgi:DNA repair protein RecO (recombination protein O)
MSESSKVVVLFTREYGKLKLAARGARRPKSKFGASLEAMTWGNYVFYRREDRDIQTLSEGDIVYAFDDVKANYGRMAAGSVICELLDHMTEDEDRNAMLFSIVIDTLRWVGVLPERLLDVPIWYFQLKAAGALGYRPHLSGCVQCGNRLETGALGFGPALGGALCKAHANLGMPVERLTLDFLEYLQTGRPDRIDLGRFLHINRAEVNRVLRSFLDQHLVSVYRQKAMDFFDRLRVAECSIEPTQEGR